LYPARLLGLNNKGILAENADADVIVVDRESAMVEQVISGGRIIFQNGEICSEDASFVTLEEGRKSIFERGFNLQCTAPEWLGR
jgi:adenine deaminase